MARTPLFSRLCLWLSEARRLSGSPRVAALSRSRAVAFERRTFLGVAASVAHTATWGCAEENGPRPPQSAIAAHRVAIVGGGLAGLTCAYWLKRAGLDATLYEANERLGGRVFTLRNELPERMFAELGGEFVDSHHATMIALAGQLEVALDEHRIAEDRRTFWFNDRRIPSSEIVSQLADVAPIITQALEAADKSEDELARLDATPLSRWLEQNVPNERYPELALLLETAFRAELGSETDEQSAMSLILLVESELAGWLLSANLAYRAREGNDRFANALRRELTDEQVKLDSRLRAVRRSNTGYSLTFETRQGVGFEAEAERVVFAVPFSVLRSVELSTSGLSEQKLALIRGLGYGTHAKIAAAFATGDWIQRHVSTDLPFQVAWDGTRGPTGALGALVNLVGGARGLDSRVTADDYVTRSIPDLERALLTTLTYEAGSARRMHWASAPLFQGSVSCPRWRQWQQQLSAGLPEGSLHFCGEHTSVDFRGTMEGAAESGSLVAARILEELDLPTPPGLAALLAVKSQVPQACLGDQSSVPPVTRRRTVLREHEAFAARVGLGGTP